MEKFRYEFPSLVRKNEAIEFIKEFYQYNSEINGVGGLVRYLDDYEGWLRKLENDKNIIPNEERVPALTFFLIRESDNKIVGMANIRLALNEKLKNSSGHIGYCIRPTERRKGYNKINLYLALKVCAEHEIYEVLMDCDKSNLGSAKTMQDFDATLIRETEDKESNSMLQFYQIDTIASLNKYQDIYEPLISTPKSNLR